MRDMEEMAIRQRFFEIWKNTIVCFYMATAQNMFLIVIELISQITISKQFSKKVRICEKVLCEITIREINLEKFYPPIKITEVFLSLF